MSDASSDISSSSEGSQEDAAVVNLIVGGVYYSLERADLERFPDSYFAHLLKGEWSRDVNEPVVIDRDGSTFRVISHYIYSGELESYRRPPIGLQKLLDIRKEADLYNLGQLVVTLDERILQHFQTITWAFPIKTERFECTTESGCSSDLVGVLNQIRPAVVVTGVPNKEYSPIVLPNHNLTPFNGENCHSCFRVAGSVLRSHAGVAELFNTWAFADDLYLSLSKTEPRVFAYKQDGHCTGRAVVSDKLVTMRGTILHIANSTYTGGAITCTANGTTKSINRPGECMAIRTGCTYTVDTVTSGVLVVYEVYIYGEKRGCGEVETNVESSALQWDAPGLPSLHCKCVTNADGTVVCRGNRSSESGGSSGDTTSAADIASIAITTAMKNALEKIAYTRFVDSLTTAINKELLTYSGVVIALTTYYTVTHTTDIPTRFHVDTDALSEYDLALYNILNAHYHCETVTVSLAYTDNYTTVSGNTVYCEPFKGSKLKIAAPVYGYGELFQFNKNNTWILGAIVTGLLVYRRK